MELVDNSAQMLIFVLPPDLWASTIKVCRYFLTPKNMWLFIFFNLFFLPLPVFTGEFLSGSVLQQEPVNFPNWMA